MIVKEVTPKKRIFNIEEITEGEIELILIGLKLILNKNRNDLLFDITTEPVKNKTAEIHQVLYQKVY